MIWVEKWGEGLLVHLWTPFIQSIWTPYLDVCACVCGGDMGRKVGRKVQSIV